MSKTTTTPSTTLYQEAIVEAKKLREAAVAEANKAVLEQLSPLIKEMIDKEIGNEPSPRTRQSVRLREQQEQPPQDADSGMPPPPPAGDMSAPQQSPPPPIQSPAAPPPTGIDPLTTPVAPTATPPAPAVSAAMPPIVGPDAQVLGKIETGPTGEQQLVIPIDSLFQQVGAGSDSPGVAVDAAAQPPPSPPMMDDGGASPQMQQDPSQQQQPPLSEVVKKLLNNHKRQKTQAGKQTVAAKLFLEQVDMIESDVVQMIREGKKAAVVVTKQHVLDLYKTLVNLHESGVVTPRIFSWVERRLGIVHENLGRTTTYTQFPTTTGNMKTTSNTTSSQKSASRLTPQAAADKALKSFARSLFEGTTGFDKPAPRATLPSVDGAADKEAAHARQVSGNPDRHSPKAEPAPFDHSAKETHWSEGDALLEQLEEEISKLMGEDEEEGMMEVLEGGPDTLEVSDESLVAEANAARRRLRRMVREQEEEKLMTDGDEDDADDDMDVDADLEDDDGDSDMDADSAQLTLDLHGIGSGDIEDVSVSVDGNHLDVDGDDSDDTEIDLDMSDDTGDDVDVDVAADADDDDVDDVDLDDASDEDDDDAVAAALQEIRQRRSHRGQGGRNGRAHGLVHESVKRQTTSSAATASLRAQLHETQLLTARSLYLNKLLVRDKLSGAQKRRIVEYLDSARTVLEAKEVYTRISRVLDKAGVVQNSNRPTQARSLNESVGARRAVSAATSEPSFDVSRWQKLAGLSKSTK